ncbi:hypothetical protein [Dysgonomonas capnocytophagoides]|uniref:hypothetical protein n=1 Tax=Dysgonomonas capnocytophagoides TaxID=45254 RepID=UPI0030C81112
MTNTNAKSSARREKIDRNEVFSLYKDLVRQSKVYGYAGYLCQKYFHDKISNQLRCTPDTIRKILNKGEKFRKTPIWKS